MFDVITDMVEWNRRVNFVMHYLDDFLLVGQLASMECDAILVQVFEQLGVPVPRDKLEGPTQCLTFLGFEVNSHWMQSAAPAKACGIIGPAAGLAGQEVNL